jgi:superfamily II DNA or RNA helicase/HKD family nuclease
VAELGPGLYELLITEALRARLDDLAERLPIDERPLDGGDAADRIAWHVSRQVERALLDVSDEERTRVGVTVARALLDRLGELTVPDPAARPAEPAAVLQAVRRRNPDGSPAPMALPMIPLLDTTLLTHASGEPTLWSQLQSEIESADTIDVVVAFIRRSGTRPLLDSLRRHCEAGRRLRVLTTTYTDSTERSAVDQLVDLGADVRISYDTTTTRLHAKAWVFHRESGFTTAYVGSSNLTRSAQVTGLEWNVRVSAARNPDVIAKFAAVFESYWSGGDFVPYNPTEFNDQRARTGRTDAGPHVILSPIELRPHPFQERLLELLELSRQRGHHRNLLVAATGTGKTVMAALDFGTLRERLPRSRLLLIAHREEILDQSLATFRYALRDASFGEKWVGGARPTRFDHVFASIQSLHAADLDALAAEHFDVVIVDEFHHAAAASYQRILDHVAPIELLGLTATPERSDGLPILHWFDDRIAAELRLWDAIDQQHLSPFLYFGIHDGVDLRQIPWRRGRGYDIDALSVTYTSSDAWARLVVQQVDGHADISTMRALGFCVSIEHARFMADHFRRHGIAAVAIWGDSPRLDREVALRDLAAGQVRVVFSVDLFNEGVDVPDVDTILMLRPTESPTLFSNSSGAVCARRGARRSAPCWTSSARTGPSSASTGAIAPCSEVPVATSNAPCTTSSRSYPPAATCTSTRWPLRSCCAACAKRSQHAGPPRSTSCVRCAATTRTSFSASSSTNPGSTSMTSTTARRAGPTSVRTPALRFWRRVPTSGHCGELSVACSTSTTPNDLLHIGDGSRNLRPQPRRRSQRASGACSTCSSRP